MKNIIRWLKSQAFEFQRGFNSIYKRQSEYVVNADKQKPLRKVEYHRNTYPELDRFFMRFANSRPVQGRVSGKSLAFVIGAQNIGKTEYIQKNIHELKKRQRSLQALVQKTSIISNKQSLPEFDARKSPEYYQTEIQQTVFESPYQLIVYRNCKLQGGMNFVNFIEDLHEQIVGEIVKLLVKFQHNNNAAKRDTKSIKNTTPNKDPTHNLSLLTPQILKMIVNSSTAIEYAYIYVKDVVFAILEDKDQIRLSKEGMEKLEEFNDSYLVAGRATCEEFFEKYFDQLVDIIHEYKMDRNTLLPEGIDSSVLSPQVSRTLSTIQLFYSVYARMQYEQRPQGYEQCNYKSGIETSDFLFEVVNFLTGVGRFVDFIEKGYVSVSLSQSQREEYRKELADKNNYILNGNHVDSLLCLSNLENLQCFVNKERAFLDWFDHVVLRTVGQSGFRHHFPVVVEMPNRQFMDDVFQLGKVEGSNPVVVEIPGYIQTLIKYSNLTELFEQKRASKLFETLGRNTNTWKNAIEAMAKGVSIDEIRNGEAPYQQKQRLIAESKLNRVYTSSRCLQLLNKGQLDFDILEVMRLFQKINGMATSRMSFVGTVFYRQPYFRSMLEMNVFYHSYYLPYMDYADSGPSFLAAYRELYSKIKKNNSLISYCKWRYLTKKYKLVARDLRYKKEIELLMREQNVWGREHVDLQLWTTYYGPLKEYTLEYYYRTGKMMIMS